MGKSNEMERSSKNMQTTWKHKGMETKISINNGNGKDREGKWKVIEKKMEANREMD